MPGTITVRIINQMTNADDKDVEHFSRDFLMQGGVHSLTNYALYDDSFNPIQNGTPDTNTLIDAGIAYVPDSLTAPTIYYCVQMDGNNLVNHDATSSNPRIDAIVLEVTLTTTSDADAIDGAALSVVKGAEGASPTTPSDSDINSELGHTRWIRIANVAIANPFVTVVNADITDVRQNACLNLSNGALSNSTSLVFFNAAGDPDHYIQEDAAGNLLFTLGTTAKGFYFQNEIDEVIGYFHDEGLVINEGREVYLSSPGNDKYYWFYHNAANVVYEVSPTTQNHYWNDAGRANRLRLGMETGGDSILTLFRGDGLSWGTLRYNSSSDVFDLETNNKTLRISSGSGEILFQGNLIPNGNDIFDFGSVPTHVNDVFGTNAYTTVSDETMKRDILPIDRAKSVAFMRGINNISWKWKDFEAEVMKKDEDGKVVVDEEGMPVMERVLQTHHRRHSGWGARQIKEVMDANDIDSEDFGGWVEDAETGTLAIRQGEFIPHILAYAQDIDDRVSALEAKNN